jgi:adenosylhomocysteinase
LAEQQMPGLMALRKELGPALPLRGARITGSLHMTVQTAVLIETLMALGADVRWASCNVFSTQDEAAAAVVQGKGSSLNAPSGPAVFAWKGESVEEYWWCTAEALTWPGGVGPDLIVDDGADASTLLVTGAEYEQASVPVPPGGSRPGGGGSKRFDALDGSAEGRVVRELIRRLCLARPGWFTAAVGALRGASEETTTGVHRLAQLAREGALPFPVINVNDSVTKSKFDNIYGIRHSLPDGLNRATDFLIGGKVAVVAGYGDVGKGAARALSGQGARVIVTEVDPICALQAAMDGFQVALMEDVAPVGDFFITATGNRDVITPSHMAAMKDRAVVGNIGHFDNEIDMAGLIALGTAVRRPVKDQVDEWVFPDGHAVLILSEGRLLNLGNATGHPSFVMSCSFANQVLAQVDLWSAEPGRYRGEVYRLPKALDEKVARLHLDALGVALARLSPEQAEYLGVAPDGPFKPEHYRY